MVLIVTLFRLFPFIIFSGLLAITTSYGNPGDIDRSFGSAGKVTMGSTVSTEWFRAVAVQQNGRIVTTGKNSVTHLIVIRYEQDGTLDETFANGGVFSLPREGTIGMSIAVQTDGKMVVAGYETFSANSFFIIRLNSEGSMDGTFGSDGIKFINVTVGDDLVNDLLVQSDGKIVIAGVGNDFGEREGSIMVVRLNSDGTFDSSFGSDGKVVTGFPDIAVKGYSVATQNDGKLVVSASGLTEGKGYLEVVRYLPNGQLDLSFGSNGISQIILDSRRFAWGGIEVANDGRIIVTGLVGSYTELVFDVVVFAFLADGSLDNSFGSDGKTSIVTNCRCNSMGLGIQRNGKIVVVGDDWVDGEDSDVLVARLNRNGSSDITFGDGGSVHVPIGTHSDRGLGLAIQPDGKLIIAGLYYPQPTPFDTDAFVLRLFGDQVTRQESPFDFDGDGKSDISIFRPVPGEWWYSRSSDGDGRAGQFGTSTDILAPGDFTGDGKTDIAFWRPADGSWYVLRSEDGSFFSIPLGSNGDIPMPADYDADGKSDAAVFRPNTGTWFISRSGGGGTSIAQFGANGDQPVAADFDGDGKADLAITRLVNGKIQWWINRSTEGLIVASFGTEDDMTVPGDYTGDGKADVAMFRPSTGEWFVLRSEDPSYFSFPWGTPGDMPAAGDYDGDGKVDPAIFRPSSGTWYVNRSNGSGPVISQFGNSTDQPVPASFVRSWVSISSLTADVFHRKRLIKKEQEQSDVARPKTRQP